MIARSRAVVGAGGTLAELDCQPPLTLRQVRPAQPGTCALCLVGSAAGPLAGDDLVLTLEVAPGAGATLQAAGAAIAQGRGGPAAGRLRIEAVLGAGAALRADPGPLVVRPGGRVTAEVDLRLADGATADWRELIVLARGEQACGEQDRGEQDRGEQDRGDRHGPGGAEPDCPAPAARLRWDVTRGGRPLLRQLVDLREPRWQRWPGMIAGQRVLAAALLAGPGVTGTTVVASPLAAAQQIAADAVLITVLAEDAAAAARQRDELCAACGLS